MIYYVLMNLTYVGLYTLTMISFYFGFIVGIFTAGIGTIITFGITSNYIVKIHYKNLNLFIWGGLAFLITDIFHFIFITSYDVTPIEYLFKIEGSISTLFVEVFLFWQLLTGIKLFLTLQKT
jgi:hypothetical protein